MTKITKDTKAGTTLKTEPLAEVPLAQGAVEYHNVGDDSWYAKIALPIKCL